MTVTFGYHRHRDFKFQTPARGFCNCHWHLLRARACSNHQTHSFKKCCPSNDSHHHHLNSRVVTLNFDFPNSYATAIRDRHFTIRLVVSSKLPSKNSFQYFATDLYREEPLYPVIYRFTGWTQGSDSILLMPPQEADNQQPFYRITVQLDLNPFLPISYITRVFRCGVEDWELVGYFGFVYSLEDCSRFQHL